MSGSKQKAELQRVADQLRAMAQKCESEARRAGLDFLDHTMGQKRSMTRATELRELADRLVNPGAHDVDQVVDDDDVGEKEHAEQKTTHRKGK